MVTINFYLKYNNTWTLLAKYIQEDSLFIMNIFYEFSFQNKITLNPQFEAIFSTAYVNLSPILEL